MKKLVLIDGNSIAYRAFFALPLLNNEKGVYTNAVYGFTTMLLKIIEEEKPTHMLVAFDAGKTTFRHKTFDEYKGGRQKTPPELSEQFPLVRELLDAFNISRFELENYEADDIIGTLAKKAANKDFDVKVFSGDKDLLQLVSDKVTVVLTKKGITNVEAYDEALIEEKYGITPNQIIDMKGLMGDSSDNIPGVPGVGEKTALKLLKEFGSVEKVLESIDQISGKKMKEKLEENREQALMSKELATIFLEVPFDTEIDDLSFGDYDQKKVVDFMKELEFTSLVTKFDTEGAEEIELEEITFDILEEVEDKHLTTEAALIVEVLDENYHQAPIEGFALVNEKGRFFIPTEKALDSVAFVNWLKDESTKISVFDAKQAVVSLGWQGILLNGVVFDLQMASYLLDPSLSSHNISDVAMRKGIGQLQEDEFVYGKGAKRRIPGQDELAEHLVRKAMALYQLKPVLEAELKENEQEALFRDLEMPLSLVLGRMETTGVKVDKEQLQQMGEDLEFRLNDLEKKIHQLAGTTFNINSPKQLGEILFEKLGLPPVKKTKTGYSTSADVLEKLAEDHEIVEYILHYRQLGKLNSTYIEGLLKVTKEDTSKIHTRYNQALTQTGRLSSTDPNLQNIPIRLEEGRRIRKAFISSEAGWKVLAADYSQIELRVLAHISEDAKLIEAFQTDMDVHTKTAMDVFHVSAEEVTSNMRRSAKAVNFGIVYGISDFGLSQSLGITRKEAGQFIERYFASYPRVKEYMDNIIEDAREKGYVSTLLQRRRYLPDLTSRNFNKRSFAERTAMNTPIQGTAADIIKKAMVEMAIRLEKEQLQSRMLLQVHDELIFEVPENEVDIMLKLVPEVMEQAVELRVPLKADVSFGETWYDAK
ncbi:DNA polymerase I [Halalkalibacter akibai]|uniref:DNA polymerase I n=1 Tax=Halalkalibacter akibai (strain ATCC 43226 / DSM 21942 / CIP 109018 / JCM 9157 / 1139) TaxID=1236973 RepID=W4QRZ8_HALA3|nr:DNA polymerase I [Halalkalibacter akibai]GAE34104.1 DNA polymerase I [Halalkalibacter akibai JCM 9157]